MGRVPASEARRAGGSADDERDRGVLERDRGDDEQVKELVVAEDARQQVGSPERVDESAERVAEAAGGDEGGRGRARVVEDLRERDDRHPTEGDGCEGRQPFRCPDPEELGEDRQAGTAPHDREHDDLPRALEDQQPEGRVRAGHQPEDAGVVEPTEPQTCRERPREAVVEGARPEHRDDGAGEDGCRELRPRPARDQAERDAERNRRVEPELVEDASQARLRRRRGRIDHPRTVPVSSKRPFRATSLLWWVELERVRFAREAPSYPFVIGVREVFSMANGTVKWFNDSKGY